MNHFIDLAEIKQPSLTLPRIIKVVWFRVTLFYVLSTFIIGLTVRHDNPMLNIAASGTLTAASPVSERPDSYKRQISSD
jgi:amino acid permease